MDKRREQDQLIAHLLELIREKDAQLQAANAAQLPQELALIQG